MERMYRVLGLDESGNSTLLEEFSLRSESIQWAKKYCKHDSGGYDDIIVKHGTSVHWAMK
jgi:hypothetical protein